MTDLPLPAENPALVKADLPDWLSPMLVKELRQGVRTKVFVILFIVLQALMLINVSLSLIVASFQEDASTGTVLFWLMVGLPVLVVLPFNGLTAVSGEIKANTLELIFLTRLTALRIVVGKWLAIFAQSMLLVCAVLPYLVLRYFIGGIDLRNELMTLGVMLYFSALLAACATGLSAYPTRIVRALVGLVIPVFLLISANAYTFRGIYMTSGGSPLGVVGWVTLILLGLILLGLMLEIGTAKIAPPAENHSIVMRLLGVCALGLAVGSSYFAPKSPEILGAAGFLALIVCAIAMGEELRWVPSLFRPFAARGFLGRVAGRILYPGWPTGVLFSLMILAGFAALLAHLKLFDRWDVVPFIAFAGTLLLPVALIRTLIPRTNKPIVFFFLVHIVCAVVTICFLVTDNVLRTHFRDMIAFLPLSTLIMGPTDSSHELRGRLISVSVTTLLSVLALLFAIVRPLRQMRKIEDQSLQLPAPTPHAPVA